MITGGYETTVKTLVVGLGNPILGDDGVGWQIANELRNQPDIPPEVSIECLAVGGISLMEAMIGYDRAILIDAIASHRDPIGQVHLFNLTEMPNPAMGHTGSAHDTSLQDALTMGRNLGAHLPGEISIVTVEAQKVYEFSETLSPPIAAAIPEAIRILNHLLIESNSDKPPASNDHTT